VIAVFSIPPIEDLITNLALSCS